MIFFRAPMPLTTLNTCLVEMEEYEGKAIALQKRSSKVVLKGRSPKKFFCAIPMVRFHTPISLLKLYVSVTGNKPTLNNLIYM